MSKLRTEEGVLRRDNAEISAALQDEQGPILQNFYPASEGAILYDDLGPYL